jgi:hypothetical protein
MSARVVKTLTITRVLNHKGNVQKFRIQLEMAGTQTQAYGTMISSRQGKR